MGASAPGVLGQRWLSAFSIGIVVVYAALFLWFLFRMGPKDQDQFLVFHELQYWNTSLFGLAKQWTPLMCSGLSLAGEPQVPFMSLSMMLSYVLGPFWGLKLATFAYFVIGWVGAYLYSGLWFKLFAQRTLAAALFIGNGFFICRLGFGHIDFIPFLILPLMLWALHRITTLATPMRSWISVLRLTAVTLLMAAGIAVAIDGSPVAIIHLLFWIGLYALVLAWTIRSPMPLIVFGSAVMIAAILDAGYLWPMLQSQTLFPRRTQDRFTSIFSLLWFALLPVRGKLLPANGNGHELSVFIGPVIGYLLWHYRQWLAATIPPSIRRPLLIVSLASIMLGMGSLKPLHIPIWLSPFDLLRPLPGFRSIGVTGRYWGFLALPLSLLSAAGLWRFASENHDAERLRRWLGWALLLQLGFQTETVLSQWLPSQRYQSQSVQQAFTHGPETMEYVRAHPRFQGEFITPTRGVADCYDEDEFIKADIASGKQVVRRVLQASKDVSSALPVQAQFVTWSHIRLSLIKPSTTMSNQTHDNAEPVSTQIVLNQAFHPLWQAVGCQTERTEHGNLVADCSTDRLRDGPVDLVFNDTMSTRAAAISTNAWEFWVAAVVTVLLTMLVVACTTARANQ